MRKYYVNVGRASDLRKRKERIFYRLLEMAPGLLVWATLLGMVFFSWLKPSWTAYFIIGFCLYWLLRTFHFMAHLVSAYLRMKANLKKDWLKELESLPGEWKDIYHLVVLPMYKEDLGLVRETFLALAKTRYPKSRMIVVLATEERAGQEAQKTARAVSREFKKKFFRFLVTCHPGGLEGEIAGKGSNETWAGREVKKKIIDPLKIPYKNIVVSCFDIDTQVYPQYFSCLSYSYLTSPGPQRCSFQPIPLYLNNVWQAPFFARVVSSSNVFWQMMQQQRPEKIVTYSSHSMSFEALVEMGFWQTNVVSEDAGIFWKSFLFYDGDYRIVPLHYPVSMDACEGETFWQAAKGQYKQQRRWAWGSEGIPYLIFGCWKNRKIPFKKEFRYIFLLIEGFWAWATNALLLLCLGWLPGLLGGDSFRDTVLAYNLPVMVRNLMTLALAGLFCGIVLSTALLTPCPRNCKKSRKLSMILQWAFFPLTLIAFGAFPAIEAQTRLLLGKRLGFWVTPKKRSLKKS